MPIEEANMQPVGWCLDAWTLGSDGVLPWQTVGSADSWKRADPLALFYPGRDPGAAPVPSLRLKAFLRGQQDVEYLTLLAQVRISRAGLSPKAFAVPWAWRANGEDRDSPVGRTRA